jgi:hypothetical protein
VSWVPPDNAAAITWIVPNFKMQSNVVVSKKIIVQKFP